MLTIPFKLKPGDEIRVIAPARSLAIISQETKSYAETVLGQMWLHVSYGKHTMEIDEFASSSIQSRINDLHEAFADKNVKGILTVVGWFNCNQLLQYIDYDLIKNNPKILCGFSDITALSNAITAKTNLVTYYGPHFSTFGMQLGNEYTKSYFQKTLMQEDTFLIEASAQRSDDLRFLDQQKREFFDNPGWIVINEWTAEGTLYAGHLSTFQLLQGTEYMPNIQDSILMIEESEEFGKYTSFEFDRILQSLIHQPGFAGVKWILIGRFQKQTDMTIEKLKKIISTKKELEHIPILADVNIWHVSPIVTLPIGWTIKMKISNNKAIVEVVNH